jgi:hypothetical protein
MWGSGVHGEPDDDLHRRIEPPENEVPVSLPRNLLLARTDDVAVALLGLQVYTTGVAFALTVRMRPSAGDRIGHTLDELVWRHGRGGSRLLVGVEFADGRWASSLPGAGGGDVVFHSRGGTGERTPRSSRGGCPRSRPRGRLRFVVRCAELGVGEAGAVLDGAVVRRAAEDVVTLWPWERPRDHGPDQPPPPPDLPDDSWFSRR